MKYCTRCILPESYPGILFNEEGVCNFCLEQQNENAVLGKEKLLEIVHSTEKTGRYDCVVPLSGGKDSSYILYYVVKELGLTPIAVNYNSGYQSKYAEENVRNACKSLGVDLEEVHSSGNIQKKILKASYELSKRTGMVWGCANCPAILRVVPINVARKNKVPYVMWGSSKTETVFSQDYSRSVSRIVKKILKNPTILFFGFLYFFFRIIQRITLRFPLRLVFNPVSIPAFTEKDPRFIHFFDYIQWDSMKNVRLLENELGWVHPEGIDSRFDCTLNCIGNVFYSKQYGITHDGIALSNFVREGKLSREEAMKRELLVKMASDEEYASLISRLQ